MLELGRSGADLTHSTAARPVGTCALYLLVACCFEWNGFDQGCSALLIGPYGVAGSSCRIPQNVHVVVIGIHVDMNRGIHSQNKLSMELLI